MSDDPNAAGRYILGDRIGDGAGHVFRAFNITLGHEVAVKVPPAGAAAARRFIETARIAARLLHPGIVPLHDLGTLPDGRPFLAMKLIKGATLDTVLRRCQNSAADRGRFVEVFLAVAQAVAYAHSCGVIHRDLTPQNVMIGAFGEAQVIGWGRARVLGSEERQDHEPDPQPDPVGTPAYLPPEQAAGGSGPVDARGDVFGLGGVLAAMLTGEPPFVAASDADTRVMAARGDVASCFARLDASGAGPDLVSLCKRCLAPDPADRPADGCEVAAAVAAFRLAADDRAVEEQRLVERQERKRMRLVLATVAALVAVAGGVAAWRAYEAGKRHADATRYDRAFGLPRSGFARGGLAAPSSL